MYFKKYLIVISEKKKDNSIANAFIKVKFTSSENNKFFRPKADTAPSIGIENKNDILAESSLLNLRNLEAVIAIPDLLTPGTKDRI